MNSNVNYQVFGSNRWENNIFKKFEEIQEFDRSRPKNLDIWKWMAGKSNKTIHHVEFIFEKPKGKQPSEERKEFNKWMS